MLPFDSRGLKSLILFLAVLVSNSQNAAHANDSILEKLEQKLESKYKKKAYRNPVDHSRENHTKTTTITSIPDETNELKSIEHEIKSLNQEVRQLNAKIRGTYQTILSRSRLKNQYEISIKMQKAEISRIQEIHVKLDGIILFEATSFKDLWMPNGDLVIFNGSLNPGTHKIDIYSKIQTNLQSDFESGQKLFHILNKTYSPEVSHGKHQKRWTLSILAPKSPSAGLKSEMIESDITL